MFGAPGSTNDAKNLKLVILVIFYPAAIGLALYLFKFVLWGIPPKWTLLATIVAPIVAVMAFGYPQMLMNANAGIPNNRYFNNNSQVFFRGKRIKADPVTFQTIKEKTPDPSYPLNDIYAVDQNQVFINGKPIPNADPKSFQIIGSDWRYTKDANHIYFEGKSIQGIDHNKFGKVQPVVENDQSYTDGVSLVYWGAIVGKIDASSIRSMGPSYVKDRNQVFYLGRKISNADPESFEVLNGGPFSRDKFRVYYSTDTVPGAHPETFQVLERSYSKDAQNVYYLENGNQVKIIDNADPVSFKVTPYDSIRKSDAYDGKNYFINGKLVEKK